MLKLGCLNCIFCEPKYTLTLKCTISRERMVVEIRDWCQNVGEYNTYNFCIWHFGPLRYSFQDRTVSKFGPPI